MAYHQALADTAGAADGARRACTSAPVILRENSAADVALGAKPLEVDGLAKPTAARVMSLARGGQTLLTAEARESLGETALQVAVARPLGDQGRGRADRAVRGRLMPARPLVAPADGDKVYRVVAGRRPLDAGQGDPEQPAAPDDLVPGA